MFEDTYQTLCEAEAALTAAIEGAFRDDTASAWIAYRQAERALAEAKAEFNSAFA